MDKLKIVFVMALIIMLTAVAFTGCDSEEGGVELGDNSPEKAAAGYYDALKEKDFNKAFSMNLGLKDVSDEQLKLIEPMFEQFEIIEYSVGKSTKIEDDRYIVPVSVKSKYEGNESVANIEAKLVLLDGKWYIDESKDKEDIEDNYGEPVDRSKFDKTTIASVFQTPEQYAGKTFIVKGDMGASCASGCHFNITDGTNNLYIQTSFPITLNIGTTVLALGEVQVRPGRDPYMVVSGIEVVE